MRISLDADERIAWAEKELDRRIELGLYDETTPPQWESRHYLQQGYRVIAGGGGSQDHWQGGPSQHEGAICPICKKALLLFWDIDCNDSRFRAETREMFGDLERLPLYYCCRRPEPTIYQVVSRDQIQTIRPDLVSEEESPFEGYPNEFDRKPVSLEPVPRDVANLLVIANEYDFSWLDAEERGRLSEYLDEEIASILDISMSQLGGALTLTQGHRDIECPNTSCSTHHMGHPLFNNNHNKMKELAVIDVESDFEFESNSSQIAFHICWKCSTIHGEYRCD